MKNEPALVDTNILVYSLYNDAPQHAASRALMEQANSDTAALLVTHQTMAEFFAVVTNPRRVTNPKTPAEAVAAVKDFMALPGLGLLPQPLDAVSRWCDLVQQHPVRGADIFDLQLIATMLASGVNRIYTYNRGDFNSFPQIQILTP
jgi:hypothetical protein